GRLVRRLGLGRDQGAGAPPLATATVALAAVVHDGIVQRSRGADGTDLVRHGRPQPLDWARRSIWARISSIWRRISSRAAPSFAGSALASAAAGVSAASPSGRP